MKKRGEREREKNLLTIFPATVATRTQKRNIVDTKMRIKGVNAAKKMRRKNVTQLAKAVRATPEKTQRSNLVSRVR